MIAVAQPSAVSHDLVETGTGISHDVLEAGVGRTQPVYVYDLQRLRERCQVLEMIPVARKSIYFATMANDHGAVLGCIRDQGHGVFVNSPRHLRLVHDLGFAPERIVYAATNMLAEEMELCLRLGVRLILDSLGQLQLFAALARPGEEVGLRLSVGSALDGEEFRDDPSYRFGVLPAELPLAVEIARRRGVRIVGAHSYFGTDLLSPELLAQGMEQLGRVADLLPDLRYLDVGGGFGVTTRNGPGFDIAEYGRLAQQVMADHERRRGHPLELVLEPGRYVAATCGFFFVTVVDVKERRDRVFAGTNGSVAIFPRPLMYPDRAVHPCEIVGPRGRQPCHERPVYICGNSTYSRDFLAREVRMPLPVSGDTIVFHNAGAYCRSMITEFLGKDRPEEIVVDSASSHRLHRNGRTSPGNGRGPRP
jgi:diaminopimelate decarboxylase